MFAIAVIALTTSLGFWQLRRADYKAALIERAAAARAAGPIELRTLEGRPELEGAQVRVRGRYDPARVVFIDNRTLQGQAGFHVVMPLQPDDGGDPVLVMRGWIAQNPQDRSRLPALVTPEGPVVVDASAQTTIEQVLELGKTPLPGPDEHLWLNIDYARFEAWSGLRVRRVFLRQLPAGDDDARADRSPDHLVRVAPVFPDDVSRHQGYAFQWFAMAAVAVVLWLRFTLSARRRD